MDAAGPSATHRGSTHELELETLVAAYRPRIYRHVLAMVHDPADAEDLTQEAYVRALQGLAGLRDPDLLRSWLYRVATNVCLDHLRRAGSSALIARTSRLASSRDGESGAQAELRDHGPGVETVLERAEMSACVRGYLEGLHDDQRVAILLHDLNELSNPEIAELLGCSLATVKIRVHRARQRLREMLSAHCEFSVDPRGIRVCEERAPIEEASRRAGA